jgi:hypothetical protein
MDKLIEDLLTISCDIEIEIEEIIEEVEEKKEINFVDNPDRFDINCNCESCRSLIQNCFEDL